MNINKILPVLFKAVQVTGPKQPVRQHTAQTDVKQFQPVTTTKNASADKPAVTIKPVGSGLMEVAYLPLPLKSAYFNQAQFFVRRFSNKQQAAGEANCAFFIKLDTDHLGTLWIGLETVNNKGLIVRMVAEKEEYQQALKSILPEIKQDLEGHTYQQVVTSCIVQADVRHCQDIDPDAYGLTVVTSMKDWQV